MSVKVKPEFANMIIGFNGSSKPLGERDDLNVLYDNAKRAGHKHHLKLFQEVDEKEVSASKSASFLKKQEDKKA